MSGFILGECSWEFSNEEIIDGNLNKIKNMAVKDIVLKTKKRDSITQILKCFASVITYRSKIQATFKESVREK